MKNRQIKFNAVLQLESEGEKINIIIPDVTLYSRDNETQFGVDLDAFNSAIEDAGYKYEGDGLFTHKTKNIDHCNTVLDGEDWVYFEGIPLQLTGLQDKNGKDIYEGDIVKTPDGGTDEITWDEVAFHLAMALAASPDGKCAALETKVFDKIEVIGNKYSNPELL